MDLMEEFNKLDMQKCFLVGVGLVFFYWLLFYDGGKTLDAQIAQQIQSQKKNETALQRVRKALDDKVRFEEEIQTISRNMQDFQKYFSPEGMSINVLQSRVSKLAENHSLIVNKMEPGERSSEFPKYKETAVTFSIEGPFHNVMEFISSLTKQERAIDFSEMNFKSTVKGDYPLVELTTTLVVYTANEVEGGAQGG